MSSPAGIENMTFALPVWSMAAEVLAIRVSLSKSEEFEHVSMVNGLVTSRGGEHVEYIANKIVSHLSDVYQKKLKKC